MKETSTVSVGEPAKEFTIVKSIATRSSKYFEVALANCWKEGREKRIELPKHLASTFEGYLQWLYTNEVTLTDTANVFQQLCYFYVLGDYLDDPNFCNAIIDRFMAVRVKNNRAPHPKAVESAWTTTHEDSSLRSLILHMWSGASITVMLEIFESGPDRYGAMAIDFFKHLLMSYQLKARRPTTEDVQRIAEKLKRQIPKDESGLRK